MLPRQPATTRRREVLRAGDMSDADLAAIAASEMNPRHRDLDRELEAQPVLDVYELRRTCIACPSQWDGRVGEQGSIYIRYRGGIMRVHVSLTTKDAYNDGEIVFHEDVGCQIDDRGGGYLETPRMQELLASRLRFHGPCDELAHTRYETRSHRPG
jgi:hypothetical protein